MLQQLIEYLNEHPAIIGIVMCLIGVGFLVFYVLDRRNRKRMKRKIRKLKSAVASKEKRIEELESEVWRLKVDRFAADQDAKREIKKRDERIQKLETDKKQMMKWGTEK